MAFSPTRKEDALLELGRTLKDSGYHFTTITPASHRRVLEQKRPTQKLTSEDIFGWNKTFRKKDLPSSTFNLLAASDALEKRPGGVLRSRVRFSSIGDDLFLHSAYPTIEEDSVFFGPDTYRFIRYAEDNLPTLRTRKLGHAVDLGCGSGAGGIALRKHCDEVVLSDINSRALSYSKINVLLNVPPADVEKFRIVRSNLFRSLDGKYDLIMANPPFIIDEMSRTYRDGGGKFGIDLSIKIIKASLTRLTPEGVLLLYTGSAIQNGEDPLLKTIQSKLKNKCLYRYEELDPDIFGEELVHPAYRTTDRIAAIGARIRVRHHVSSDSRSSRESLPRKS